MASTIPNGWSTANYGNGSLFDFNNQGNNANPYLQHLGYGIRRTTGSSPFNDATAFESPEALANNATGNANAEKSFYEKYGQGAQVIQRRLGGNDVEFSVLGEDGKTYDPYKHTFRGENFLEKNMPAITLAAIAAMTGAGLSGIEFGGAGAAGEAAAGAAGLPATGATNAALIESAAGTAGYGASSAGLGGATGASGLSSILNGLPSTPSTGNKVVDNLIKNVISKSLGGGSGGVSTLGNILSGVSNGIGYNRTDNLIDEIKGIYKPDGEYAKYLENRLARQDSAAGRNSQYGPRLAQLTGMLADSQSRALQGLNPLMQQQQGNLNGVLGAGGRLFDTFGGTDYLKKLFSGGGMSTEWALGPNAGPQLPEGVSNVTDLLDWFD